MNPELHANTVVPPEHHYSIQLEKAGKGAYYCCKGCPLFPLLPTSPIDNQPARNQSHSHEPAEGGFVTGSLEPGFHPTGQAIRSVMCQRFPFECRKASDETISPKQPHQPTKISEINRDTSYMGLRFFSLPPHFCLYGQRIMCSNQISIIEEFHLQIISQWGKYYFKNQSLISSHYFFNKRMKRKNQNYFYLKDEVPLEEVVSCFKPTFPFQILIDTPPRL